MASSMASKLVCVVLICMIVSAPVTQAAITCGLVMSKLTNCLSYLQGNGVVSAACCNGVKALNAAAATTPDRRAACTCIKNTAFKMPGINYGNAAALPGKCGINLPYKVSPSIDCNTIQ